MCITLLHPSAAGRNICTQIVSLSQIVWYSALLVTDWTTRDKDSNIYTHQFNEWRQIAFIHYNPVAHGILAVWGILLYVGALKRSAFLCTVWIGVQVPWTTFSILLFCGYHFKTQQDQTEVVAGFIIVLVFIHLCPLCIALSMLSQLFREMGPLVVSSIEERRKKDESFVSLPLMQAAGVEGFAVL